MMDTKIIVQISRVDKTDFRIISYDRDSVHVVNIDDTTALHRDEVWVGHAKTFKGRNLRKLFQYFLKDKRYTNLSYRETGLTKSEWMEFLNDIAFYHFDTSYRGLDDITSARWEVEIVSPATYKLATGKILGKKYAKNHKKQTEEDDIPF